MKPIIKNIIVAIQQLQFIKSVSLLILIALLLNNHLHAQAPSDPGATDPDSVPIDGGLSLLVAAGVGYGAKKMKGKR